MGVVVRRYIDILTIINTFPLVLALFWQQHPYFFVDFLIIIILLLNREKRRSIELLAGQEL